MTRHLTLLTISDILALKASGNIKSAPRNRTIIKDDDRPRGTCNGYWNGLLEGYNPGQMVGYSLEDCAVVATAFARKKFDGVTLLVTDFGHRLDWLSRDPGTIVFADGNTLETLKAEHPVKYETLMRIQVSISMTTHPDKEFLEDFAAKEYSALNTTQTPHSLGELVVAQPRNATREEAELVAEEVIKTWYPNTIKKVREELAADIAMTVNGLGTSMDNFNRKDELLEIAKEPLTEAGAARTVKILKSFAMVEAELVASNRVFDLPDVELAENVLTRVTATYKAAPRGDKAALKTEVEAAKKSLKDIKKRNKEQKDTAQRRLDILTNRDFDPAYVGPVLYGFYTEPETAKGIYRRWMLKALRDKDTWKEMRKSVFECKGEGNTARYYNEKRFKAGWTRMKSMLASP
jgi:hypothetical protein